MSGIAEALLEFQKNAPHIALDSVNPHFKSKFASLHGVTEAIRPALNKVGIAYVQPLTNLDGIPALQTILLHAESGQSIEATTPLLLGGKTDPQSHGSAITYAKRYALLSILGLVGDEDDDGNAATRDTASGARQREAGGQPNPRPSAPAPNHQGGASAPPPPAPPGDDIPFAPELPFEPPTDGITAPQMGALKAFAEKLIRAEKMSVEQFRAHLDAKYGVTSTKALTKKQASAEIEHWKAECVKAGLVKE